MDEVKRSGAQCSTRSYKESTACLSNVSYQNSEPSEVVVLLYQDLVTLARRPPQASVVSYFENKGQHLSELRFSN